MKNKYVLNGDNIYDLKSFLEEFAKMVNAPNGYFGNDLFQFDDCLFGGFGLEAPCVIIWRNSNISKQRLNSLQLIEYCQTSKEYAEDMLIQEIEEFSQAGVNPNERELFFSDVVDSFNYKIEKAMEGELTLFDNIVSLIESVSERAIFNKSWTIDLVLE